MEAMRTFRSRAYPQYGFPAVSYLPHSRTELGPRLYLPHCGRIPAFILPLLEGTILDA
jgi:hypothetical protein